MTRRARGAVVLPDRWLSLPETIRNLPVDPRRRLPVPFTTGIDPETGEGIFAITDSGRVERCWRERRCGVCGEPLPAWVAFLGGSASADRWRGAYTDPWMHEDCAEASTRVCPYIARPKVPRLTDGIELELAIPLGELDGKRDAWVMVICRRDLVRSRMQPARNGEPIRIFQPGARNPRRERRWTYDGNRLVEAEAPS